MRLAMADIDLAVVAGRRGELEQAVAHGRSALEPARRSPQLLTRAAELHRQLSDRYPYEPLVGEYGEQLGHERRAIAPPGDDPPMG